MINGQQKLNTEKFNADKITLVPFGDNHLGSKFCDLDLLKQHIDWVYNSKDTYALFMGDNIDAGTRDSVGASVYEQTEIIDAQMEEWQNLVKPLVEKNKIIGTHSGNHEYRVYKSTGIDICKIMAKSLGIKYFGWNIINYFKVGNQNYTIFSGHGSGGSRLPHTKIKAVLDRMNMADAEIYLMGHLHALDHHVRQFYHLDKKKGIVIEAEKHFVLCGSYLNHWESYGAQAGYELLKKGSPKIKLSGIEKRIKVSI